MTRSKARELVYTFSMDMRVWRSQPTRSCPSVDADEGGCCAEGWFHHRPDVFRCGSRRHARGSNAGRTGGWSDIWHLPLVGQVLRGNRVASERCGGPGQLFCHCVLPTTPAPTTPPVAALPLTPLRVSR